MPLVEEFAFPPHPWEVARQLAHRSHLFVFDSATIHPDRGRYSYVMADPVAWHPITAGSDPFPLLKSEADRPRIAGLPPFQGGRAFLLSYEVGRTLEPRVPSPRHDEFHLQLGVIAEYAWVMAFDHLLGQQWIIIHDDPRLGMTPTALMARLRNDLNTQHRMATRPASIPLEAKQLVPQSPLPGWPGVTSNFSQAEYQRTIQRAIEYIHAGDCFQVNIAQRLLAPMNDSPLDLYERLRTRNPAPYAGYFDLGQLQVLSASPEQFLRVDQGIVSTRPIKGTRPRETRPDLDRARLDDLQTNPKDRSENVMIVDLLRNDLGKVCEFGSVTVPRICELESFAFVHHLVSEVQGRLRPGIGPHDLLRGAFPGGSITGAPKVRSMEIIAELEPTARGPYCGSAGLLSYDGTLESNILIRTMTVSQGWVQFPVGGGIVADSDPVREYDETLHKAAGMLRALDP